MNASRRGKKIALLLAVLLVVGAIITGFTSVPQIVARIRFHLAFESLGLNPQGQPEYRHRQTGIIFVAIRGGTFTMGSPEDEKGRQADERQYEVALAPYLIAKYELRQSEWARVMGTGFPDAPEEDLPVQSVSWSDCRRFCDSTALSIPTETQWRLACAQADSEPLDEVAWYQGNSRGHVHAVGPLRPNNLGVYDILGNVCEWCENEESWSTEGKPIRGGGFTGLREACTCAFRLEILPTVELPFIGFRPVYNTR